MSSRKKRLIVELPEELYLYMDEPTMYTVIESSAYVLLNTIQYIVDDFYEALLDTDGEICADTYIKSQTREFVDYTLNNLREGGDPPAITGDDTENELRCREIEAQSPEIIDYVVVVISRWFKAVILSIFQMDVVMGDLRSVVVYPGYVTGTRHAELFVINHEESTWN